MITRNATSAQATPARTAAADTQYQTRPGRSFAGGEAKGAPPSASLPPPGGLQPPGGLADVAMTAPPSSSQVSVLARRKGPGPVGPDGTGPWSLERPPWLQTVGSHRRSESVKHQAKPPCQASSETAHLACLTC